MGEVVDLEARLAALRQGVDPDETTTLGPLMITPARRAVIEEAVSRPNSVRELIREARAEHYRYYVPLEQAVDDVIESASVSIEDRIYVGIPEFDQAMRGLRPGELCLVVGYAHSGKTVFATQTILNNRHKRIVLFTMDETRPLVLTKLASLVHGISAEEIEARIEKGDEQAKAMLRSTVLDEFPHLAVFDDLHSLEAMSSAVEEVTDHWGAPPQLVVLDYLDLLQGSGEDVPGKTNAIKTWGKQQGLPTMVLHQSSRTKGSSGAKVSIDSGGYGGEQQAIFLVGVRRKRSQYQALIDDLEISLAKSRHPEDISRQLDDARYELSRHSNTITFSLVKNKRPPSRLVDDLDFYLDPDTGRVKPIGMEPGRRLSTVDDAMAARAWSRRFEGMNDTEEETF